MFVYLIATEDSNEPNYSLFFAKDFNCAELWLNVQRLQKLQIDQIFRKFILLFKKHKLFYLEQLI